MLCGITIRAVHFRMVWPAGNTSGTENISGQRILVDKN
jgi:hypothetical protein